MEEKYARKIFPIFYDTTGDVAKMLNQQVIWYKLGRMPGLLIVDKQGMVRFAYYSENMHDIPQMSDVLEILEQIEGKKLIKDPPEKPHEG